MRRRITNLLSQVMVCIKLVCSASVVSVLWPCAGLAQRTPAKATPDFLHELSDSFQSLTRRVSPAVVQILVTSYGPVREGEETAPSPAFWPVPRRSGGFTPPSSAASHV